MDDNSLSIDLRKVRKSLPPPPVEVPPLHPGASMPPPAPVVTPVVSAPSTSVSAKPRLTLTAKPKMKILAFIRGYVAKVPPIRLIIFGIVILAFLGGGYYIYTRFWTHSPFGPTGVAEAGQLTTAAATTTAELSESEIIERVGKLILLPDDETPTLAKVSDPAALQSQVFFKNATVGDVVLMYAKALRAILYDPTQNKIIEIGPIADASSTPTTTVK